MPECLSLDQTVVRIAIALTNFGFFKYAFRPGVASSYGKDLMLG